jgi:glucosylceramidase
MNSTKLKNCLVMKLMATFLLGISILNCSPSSTAAVIPTVVVPPTPVVTDIEFWLTKSDQSVKLEKQSAILKFGTSFNNYNSVEINDATTYQEMEGFGYTLTGGSAQVINQLGSAAKKDLLQELFGQSTNSISINYLRVSIGASDLDASVFSYNDIPTNQTDINLNKFSISPDMTNLIPLLKEIIAINPNIKIMGSPWSAPLWMKDNKLSVGGSLLPQYYNVYAQYFVKYIQVMKQSGITIDAITPQNEPLHPGNNPSMYMLAAQQNDFIKNHLGPAFAAAGIKTKIIIYDHNCDKPEYALSLIHI